MSLIKLSVHDGSSDKLRADRKEQREGYGQDFEDFAYVTFSVLSSLAVDGHPKAEVYGYHVGIDCWVTHRREDTGRACN
jgi:hypothetical protein